MKKLFVFIVFSILLLGACGTEESGSGTDSAPATEGGEDKVASIIVKDANRAAAKEQVFEKEEDIALFQTAIENGQFHEGPTTAEAPAFRFTVTNDDGTAENYLLWLERGKNAGRFQKSPAEKDGVHILRDADAAALSNLLAEK